MVWLIAKSLTIFLLSVVECQRSWHAKFHDLVHEIIKGNIIKWCIISLHIFGKEVISYYLIEQNVLEKQSAFFHGGTVKGAESDISTRKPRSIFKTLGLGMDHYKSDKKDWPRLPVLTLSLLVMSSFLFACAVVNALTLSLLNPPVSVRMSWSL